MLELIQRQHRVPFGYMMIDGYIYIHEENKKIVLQIYSDYIHGISQKKIALDLTNSSIKTPTGKDQWSHASVRAILTNIKYLGDEYHPAIISQEIFQKAKTKRETINNEIRIRSKHGSKNRYTNKIRCASCGAIYTKKKVYNKYHRCKPQDGWVCKNYIKDNAKYCDNYKILEAQLDDAYLRLVAKLKNNPKLFYKTDDHIYQTNFEINKLTVLIETYIKKSEKNISEFNELLLKRAAEQYKVAIPEDSEYLSHKIAQAIRNNKDDIFPLIIKNVIIYNHKKIGFELINKITIPITLREVI